ncbi:MAG TPA: hypothetical protein VG755_10660 [Nannocystaceae bacterium]|nr:hypothetical protein [Nannocystaceae bacterium]
MWDDARKTEIEAAVRATGASFAASTWSRLAQNVDGWRTDWIAGFVDACEAAQVRGTQSQQLMDQRMACLAARRQRLVAYLDLLATPTVETLASADEGFAALPEVSLCADVDYVTHRGQRSDVPEIAAIEDAVLTEVARARSLQAAGDFDGALAVARGAVATSEPSPLARAHALLALGIALKEHRPREAVPVLEEAYTLARATDSGDIAAESAEELTDELAFRTLSTAAAKTWLLLAQAETERRRDPAALARFGVLEAQVLRTVGDIAASDKSLDAAFERLQQAGLAETMTYAQALAARSRSSNAEHDTQDAEAALALATRLLGNDHPSLMDFELTLAEVLSEHGDDVAASQHVEAAVDIGVRAFGPDSDRIALPLARLALIVNKRGRSTEAIGIIRRDLTARCDARRCAPRHLPRSRRLPPAGRTGLRRGGHGISASARDLHRVSWRTRFDNRARDDLARRHRAQARPARAGNGTHARRARARGGEPWPRTP